MAVAALALYGIWMVLAFGVRIAIQWRRTGSTGVRGLDRNAGAVEQLAGILFVLALAMGGAAPPLALLDVLEPIAALNGSTGHVLGLILAVGGISLTFFAQLAMGDAWRIGVDSEERTDLVTGGPFQVVRNPIYSAMVPTALGLALLVPSVIAVAGFVALAVALELQVRLVEEPYLRRTHGDAFADYASRVGRFVPGVGMWHGVR